jgi:aspartate racemase
MKTMGLIGGMSWESTALYYQVMNREVARRLGGLHSARIHLLSLDFEEVAALQRAGQWDALAQLLVDAALRLERAGADCVLIGTNTMHLVAPQVEQALKVPLLHIADVCAQAIRAQGLQRVGLLGTGFTMAQPFYRERLALQGVHCLVPPAADQDQVHRIIFDELCKGVCRPASRQLLQRICADLAAQGAQGVILGCTELPLILSDDDVELPLFDTTTLHALAAVSFALEGASSAWAASTERALA